MNGRTLSDAEIASAFRCQKRGCQCQRPLADGTWMVHCPEHDDSTPSLHVGPAGALHCFAGCDLSRVRKQLGRGDPASPGWVLVDSYPYCEPDGTVVAIKKRFEKFGAGKSTPWYHPDGKTRGCPVLMRDLPIFNAQQVAASPGPIWICEGEKAAKALIGAGVVATTFAFGSSVPHYIRPATLEPLAGKELILWRDNDQPGMKWARDLSTILRPVAASLRVVVAPGDDGDDAYDWIAAGRTPEELLALSSDVSVEEQQDRFRMSIAGQQGRIAVSVSRIFATGRDLSCRVEVVYGYGRIPFYADLNLRSQSGRETLIRSLKGLFGDRENWSEIVHRISHQAEAHVKSGARPVHISRMEKDEFGDVIHNFIVDRAVTILYGTGASMKSLTALSAAIAVADETQDDWLGLPVYAHGPVIIVDYEDAGAIRGRVERMLAVGGKSIDALPIHVIDPRGQAFVDILEDIKDAIAETGARLLIVDSAMHAVDGAAEDSVASGRFLRAARATGIPVLVISHTNRADSAYAAKWGDPSAVPRYPYGNVVWRNLARRTLFQRTRQVGAYGVAVEVVETKANTRPGFSEEPMRLLVSFAEGAIDISRPTWLPGIIAATSPQRGRGLAELPMAGDDQSLDA